MMRTTKLVVLALGLVCSAAFAQGANPFAKKPQTPPPATNQGVPVGMPPGLNPGVPTGGMPPGYQPPALPIPEEIEEVSASRIGRVNGLHIYRGNSVYVFESTKDKKITKRVAPPAIPGTGVAPVPAQPVPVAPNLPSAVGRPAPPTR